MKTISVLIEIPEGSNIKYELNEKTKEIIVDRLLPTPMTFPANYGLIKNTLGGDGDALDALVFISKRVVPNVTIECKIIGLLEMEDEGGIDHKIICVPVEKVDSVCGAWQSLADIPQSKKDQVRHFFEHYKDLEKEKWVKLKDWKDINTANKILETAQKRFRNK